LVPKCKNDPANRESRKKSRSKTPLLAQAMEAPKTIETIVAVRKEALNSVAKLFSLLAF
jgi:hypothetical protein